MERRREPHARHERVPVRHRERGQRVARHGEPDDVRRRNAERRPRPSRTSICCASSRPTPVKSLAIVLGSELRVENYAIHAGDLASLSARHRDVRHAGAAEAARRAGVPRLPAEQRGRSHARQHRHLRRPRVRAEQGASRSTSAGASRATSDFGQSLIGKAAARAKLGGGLSLRAARQHRLPRAVAAAAVVLERVDAVPARTRSGNLQPTQVLTSNNESPVTKAFGIPKLHEEKSTNFSTGVAYAAAREPVAHRRRLLHPHPRSHRADQPVREHGSRSVAQILSPFPGVSQAQFFANAVDTDTSGADVVADYATESGGTLTFTGAANFSQDGRHARQHPVVAGREVRQRRDAADVLLRPRREEPARGPGAAPEGISRGALRRRTASRRSCAQTTTARSTSSRTTRRTTRRSARRCCSTSTSATSPRRTCTSRSAPTTCSTRFPTSKPRTRTRASAASSTAETSASSA